MPPSPACELEETAPSRAGRARHRQQARSELEQQLKTARDEAAGPQRARRPEGELGRVTNRTERPRRRQPPGADAARVKGELEARVHQLQAEIDACTANSRRRWGPRREPRRRPTGAAASWSLRAAPTSSAPRPSSPADAVEQHRATSASERRMRAATARVGQCVAASGQVRRRGRARPRRVRPGPRRTREGPRRGGHDAERARRARRDVEDVKAAGQGRDRVDELRPGSRGGRRPGQRRQRRLDALRRDVETRGHHATDLQQALRAGARRGPRARRGDERDHKDALHPAAEAD